MRPELLAFIVKKNKKKQPKMFDQTTECLKAKILMRGRVRKG